MGKSERSSRTAPLTADTARQMGQDRLPLRLRHGSLTISLLHVPSSGGDVLCITAVQTRTDSTICTLVAEKCPVINTDSIQSRGAFIHIAPADAPTISAWLGGYYGTNGGAA